MLEDLRQAAKRFQTGEISLRNAVNAVKVTVPGFIGLTDYLAKQLQQGEPAPIDINNISNIITIVGLSVFAVTLGAAYYLALREDSHERETRAYLKGAQDGARLQKLIDKSKGKESNGE